MTDATLHESGMKVTEACKRAEQWWMDYGGRHMLSKELNKVSNVEEIGRRFTPAGKKTPAILIKGSMEPVIPSGILRGLPWDELTSDEKLRIVNVWHREYIVSPLHGMARQQGTLTLN